MLCHHPCSTLNQPFLLSELLSRVPLGREGRDAWLVAAVSGNGRNPWPEIGLRLCFSPSLDPGHLTCSRDGLAVACPEPIQLRRSDRSCCSSIRSLVACADRLLHQRVDNRRISHTPHLRANPIARHSRSQILLLSSERGSTDPSCPPTKHRSGNKPSVRILPRVHHRRKVTQRRRSRGRRRGGEENGARLCRERDSTHSREVLSCGKVAALPYTFI